MALISVRLPDQLLTTVDKEAKKMHITRGAYIRQALEAMNADAFALSRAEHLKRISLKVRDDSMRINKEFDELGDDEQS